MFEINQIKPHSKYAEGATNHWLPQKYETKEHFSAVNKRLTAVLLESSMKKNPDNMGPQRERRIWRVFPASWTGISADSCSNKFHHNVPGRTVMEEVGGEKNKKKKTQRWSSLEMVLHREVTSSRKHPLIWCFDAGRAAVALNVPLGAKCGCIKRKLLLSMLRWALRNRFLPARLIPYGALHSLSAPSPRARLPVVGQTTARGRYAAHWRNDMKMKWAIK